jgi:hypothetical protein
MLRNLYVDVETKHSAESRLSRIEFFHRSMMMIYANELMSKIFHSPIQIGI